MLAGSSRALSVAEKESVSTLQPSQWSSRTHLVLVLRLQQLSLFENRHCHRGIQREGLVVVLQSEVLVFRAHFSDLETVT